MTDTERAIRAATCVDCAENIPFTIDDGVEIHHYDCGFKNCSRHNQRCTSKHRELLPLLQEYEVNNALNKAQEHFDIELKAATERAIQHEVNEKKWAQLFHSEIAKMLDVEPPKLQNIATLKEGLEAKIQQAVAGAYEAAAKQCESDAAAARGLIATNTGTELGNSLAETVAATGEELAKRIRALTTADARQASQFTNQRLFDLVRHQRSELHVAELITDDEYATLAQEHSAVKRLEDYDAAIASAEARGRLEEMVWLWGKDFGDAYNGGYLNERGRELVQKRIAAARSLTPDAGEGNDAKV